MEEELKFEKVYLQENVINKLQASYQKQKIAQTYIFCGKSSLGKTKLALIFSALLQCDNPQKVVKTDNPLEFENPNSINLAKNYNFEPCNSCKSCTLIKKRNHPDVKFIKPLGQEIKVDQIREMQENAYIHPYLGKWKIFIIEHADKLNEFSGNSMLKILEETPRRVIFILIAENLFNILTTIISRAEILNLTAPTHQKARFMLKKLLSKSEKYINLIYSLAEAKFGKTLEIASNNIIDEEYVENYSPSKLKEAHKDYLESFDELFQKIYQKLILCSTIEDQVYFLDSLNFYISSRYMISRKNFIRGLLLAKCLPQSFSMLYSSLFVDRVQEFERNLSKLLERSFAQNKQSFSSEMAKTIEKQMNFVIKNVSMAFYYDFLEVFLNFLRDCYTINYLGLEADEILNINLKNDIITLANFRGMRFVEELIDVIIKSIFALRHNVQPLLVFENFFTEIGGKL